MKKFYGQRTCTLDATTCTQDYYQINHNTVAEMLYEENLLQEIDTIQISTCHRYISICFKTREQLLEFCENEHIILTDTLATFIPDDYDRIRISIENLPIELPDEDVIKFLSTNVQPIGKTYYTGKRHHNKYYTTGTRVYQCIYIKEHLPRHIYQFGRYLRIRYDSQPPLDSITIPQNNTNDVNINEDIGKTPGPTTHNQIPETTPVPTLHDTPIITTTSQLIHETRDTTIQPTENTQTETGSQTEIETDTETETDTRTKEDTKTKPQVTRTPPTLTPYEKTVYSSERQKHILYWRGYVEWGGRMKKRYELYPNQLYQLITNQDELDTYYEKTESGRYMNYKDIQDEIRQSSRYYDIDRRKETFNIIQRTDT